MLKYLRKFFPWFGKKKSDEVSVEWYEADLITESDRNHKKIAFCSKCGIELKEYMYYYCGDGECPSFQRKKG